MNDGGAVLTDDKATTYALAENAAIEIESTIMANSVLAPPYNRLLNEGEQQAMREQWERIVHEALARKDQP